MPTGAAKTYGGLITWHIKGKYDEKQDLLYPMWP